MKHNNPLYVGILAGIWPCGIVTLIRELFLAESKSQVYGHLHEFLQTNPEVVSNISKLLMCDVMYFSTVNQEILNVKKFSDASKNPKIKCTKIFLHQTSKYL